MIIFAASPEAARANLRSIVWQRRSPTAPGLARLCAVSERRVQTGQAAVPS